MLKKILVLNKKIGETPLECLNRFRKDNPLYQEFTLSYLGRLDPMAEGLLLVLVGAENKKRTKYLSLDKEYVFDILFGFATDTYDLLGKVLRVEEVNFSKKEMAKELPKILKGLEGQFQQKYPPYSSKTVGGVPLFELARAGKINKEDLPEKMVEIKKIKLEKVYSMSIEKIKKEIEKRIAKVGGDFRQKEITTTWSRVLTRPSRGNLQSFVLARVSIKCSTGTYVRSLVEVIGEKIGLPAVTFAIKRTKVGKWRI